MDDALGGCALAVGGIALAAIAIYFAVWIALALLVRIVAFVVLYYLVSVTFLLFGGIVFGVWIPYTVLTGRGNTNPLLLTPARVVNGTAFRKVPGGPARHFGWDRAWPTYLPYQARSDAIAVIDEMKFWCRRSQKFALGEDGARWPDGTSADIRNSVPEPTPYIGRLALFWLPHAAFCVGLAISISLWLLIMVIVGAVLSAGRLTILWFYRIRDRATLKRRKASMNCVYCFGESAVPSYQCSNKDCSVIHRDIRPGPLGIVGRRCECGSSLPTTVTRAAAVLVPVCPGCDAPQPDGAGTRHTILVPVIGEVAAGKTRLLASATVALAQKASLLGGQLTGLTQPAAEALAQYSTTVAARRDTLKTRVTSPLGLSFLLTSGGSTPVEIQLVDVAGEHFKDWESTASLRYLDHAKAMLFVIDPLAFENIRAEYNRSAMSNSVAVASGQAQHAYSTAVDRLRAEGVPTQKGCLGVVLTKADVLTKLPGHDLAGADSEQIRLWLQHIGQDLLVRRLETDFGTVRYFLVDSMKASDRDSPPHPLHTLLWVASMGGAELFGGTSKATGSRAQAAGNEATGRSAS